MVNSMEGLHEALVDGRCRKPRRRFVIGKAEGGGRIGDVVGFRN